MPQLTEQQLRNWLDAYGSAWESHDPDAAEGLFTEDAEYYETPFVEPARGWSGVRAYWAATTESHLNVRFRYEVLAIAGNQGIAHWSSEFTRKATGAPVRLDGVFVLDFDEGGLCRRLLEWWHRSEGGRQDT